MMTLEDDREDTAMKTADRIREKYDEIARVCVDSIYSLYSGLGSLSSKKKMLLSLEGVIKDYESGKFQKDIIGKEIREVRKKAGITQYHLAELVGCSRQYIYLVERGSLLFQTSKGKEKLVSWLRSHGYESSWMRAK